MCDGEVLAGKSGGFLCCLLRSLAFGNLLQQFFAVRVEFLDGGEGLEEPVFDIAVVSRIRVCVLTSFIHAAQHQVFSHDGLVFVIVSGDVLLHVLEGQALVGGLRGLLGDGNNAEGGVSATNFLKLVVLGGAILGGSLGNGLVHLDGVVPGVDDDVSHDISFLYAGL